MPVIITSCSATKRLQIEHGLSANALPHGDLRAVAAAWKSRVAGAATRTVARDLYQGRNFALSKAAATLSNSKLLVVSAGLGLVRDEDTAPAYGATVTRRAPDNILTRIEPPVRASDWWHALAGGEAVAGAITRIDVSPILIALPGTYLDMIAEDLAGLKQADLSRIRVFTRARIDGLTPLLRNLVMPYDARLDGPDSPLPGTLSDFAARALMDFCRHVLAEAPDGTLEGHAAMVRTRIDAWRSTSTTSRLRKDDAELRELIGVHWVATNGSASGLLRLFRDELGIACEAGRLKRLANAHRAGDTP